MFLRNIADLILSSSYPFEHLCLTFNFFFNLFLLLISSFSFVTTHSCTFLKTSSQFLSKIYFLNTPAKFVRRKGRCSQALVGKEPGIGRPL